MSSGMQKSDFLAYVKEDQFVRVSPLIQVLCHYDDTHVAGTLFRRRMESSPLMRDTVPIVSSRDNHTKLIGTADVARLIMSLPEGQKKRLNAVGHIKRANCDLLVAIATRPDGAEAEWKKIRSCGKKNLASVGAAEFVWTLLEYAGVHVRAPLPAEPQDEIFTLQEFTAYYFTTAAIHLQRLGHQLPWQPSSSHLEVVARRSLSGHTWQAARMSWECRRALANLQLQTSPGLSGATLQAMIVSQVVVQNNVLYREMFPAFSKDDFDARVAEHSWWIRDGMRTGFLPICSRAGIRPIANAPEGETLIGMAGEFLQRCKERSEEIIGVLLGCNSPAMVCNALESHFGLNEMRSMQVARFLKFCEPKFLSFDFHFNGWGSRDVVEALEAEGAGEFCTIVGAALQSADPCGLLRRLENEGERPLSRGNLYHSACEFRKIITGADHEYVARDGYFDLVEEVRELERQVNELRLFPARRGLKRRQTS